MIPLSKPIVFWDLETTSVDALEARIVEFGCSVLHPDGSINPNGYAKRFNPGVPIPPECSEIHGITDEMVKDCPPFLSFAPALLKNLQGKDLAGFNLRRYDLIVLDTELRRCGLRLDLEGVQVIDAYGLYCKTDKRDLSSYIEKYAGRAHDGAHGAAADAAGNSSFTRTCVRCPSPSSRRFPSSRITRPLISPGSFTGTRRGCCGSISGRTRAARWLRRGAIATGWVKMDSPDPLWS